MQKLRVAKDAKDARVVTRKACDKPLTSEEGVEVYIAVLKAHENADPLLHGGRHRIAR